MASNNKKKSSTSGAVLKVVAGAIIMINICIVVFVAFVMSRIKYEPKGEEVTPQIEEYMTAEDMERYLVSRKYLEDKRAADVIVEILSSTDEHGAEFELSPEVKEMLKQYYTEEEIENLRISENKLNEIINTINRHSMLTVTPTQSPYEKEGDTMTLAEAKSLITPSTTTLREEAGVYNFIIVGEENVYANVRGRTDAIMILTLNTNTGRIKLTSIMRDTFVCINGEDYYNRINAAYAYGGLKTLKNAVERTFALKITGVVLVNFENFEKIIDELGGIDITLTAKEAEYLNTTNYITYKYNRNLVEGVNHMNGDQVLGYARVRHVSTATEAGDNGRTLRHRTIIQAIYNKYRSSDLSTMLGLLPDISSSVTTDMSWDELLKYAAIGFTLTGNDMELNRVPYNGLYQVAYIRGMWLEIIDADKNIERLHKFIFEE